MHDTNEGCPAHYESEIESYLDDRIFGDGKKQIDGKVNAKHKSNTRATKVAGRAKQFIPFAALKGFSEMVEEVSRAHDNIVQSQDDQEGSR